MEKFGVVKEDLLKELKDRYHELREELVFHVKIGAEQSREYHMIQARLSDLKARIDELTRA